MKRIVLMTVMAAAMLAVTPQCTLSDTVAVAASGSAREKKGEEKIRRVVRTGNFISVSCGGAVDIHVSQGALNVELYGTQENLDKLEVKVNPAGMLTVKMKPGVRSMQGGTTLNISVPDIEKIVSNGSGDIIFSHDFKIRNLALVSNGSGDIATEAVTGKLLKITANGSGDIRVESFEGEKLIAVTNGSGDLRIEHGELHTLKATTHGSGDVSIEEVRCQYAELITTGSGDIEAYSLHASSLKGTATGSGDLECTGYNLLTLTRTGSGEITYKGNPRQTHFSGRGGIHRRY